MHPNREEIFAIVTGSPAPNRYAGQSGAARDPRPDSMPDIVLTTLNAKYIHAAFGLRYLLANLGPLRTRARLVEFEIHQRPIDIVEALLALAPRIIGLGVYIWNATPAAEVVALLKRVQPELVVILGGPEVSYEVELQPVAEL